MMNWSVKNLAYRINSNSCDSLESLEAMLVDRADNISYFLFVENAISLTDEPHDAGTKFLQILSPV